MPDESEARPTAVALCLSGGGFRSALFHLGALRRLKELRLLRDVALLSSVSGGSILAAFFAERLLGAGPVRDRSDLARWLDATDWEREVAAPFRELASRDLRTGPILKHVLWNWAAPGLRVGSLEREYARWVSRRSLGELPEHPAFVFCATDLTFGVNWIFSRERAGDYQVGYFDAGDWPVARAVAASSCFPPIFGPMPLRLRPETFTDGRYRGDDRDDLVARLALTDGGVYDNLGLEPAWKTHDCVLVSDCGAPFELSTSENPIRRLLRYTSVVMNQASSVRKRMFFAQRDAGAYRGTYWGIRTGSGKPEDDDEGDGENEGLVGTSPSPTRGYSRELVEELIAEIRTDLDGFTEAEAKILENHGYFAVERSVSRHLERVRDGTPAARAPHPEWMDETRAAAALVGSHKRVSLRRWLRIRRERALRGLARD